MYAETNEEKTVIKNTPVKICFKNFILPPYIFFNWKFQYIQLQLHFSQEHSPLQQEQLHFFCSSKFSIFIPPYLINKFKKINYLTALVKLVSPTKIKKIKNKK
jgi:hypothetical protein